jgi:hypothetical protein
MQSLINGRRLALRLGDPEGLAFELEIGADAALPAGVVCAVGRVVEISLPWSGGPGSRLEVRLGECHLPDGAALLLEPFPADSEYAEPRRKD